MYIVRRAQSRINQIALENEMGNWKAARIGRCPPLPSSSRAGHESIWIHRMNLFRYMRLRPGDGFMRVCLPSKTHNAEIVDIENAIQ